MAKKRNVKLYALSTCIWCRKTKEFLDKSGVEYEYVYVDELAEGAEKEKVMEELLRLNPRRSFPTLSVDGDVVVGFDEEKLKRVLK